MSQLRTKSFFGIVLACVFTMSCLCINSSAAEGVSQEIEVTIARASGKFSMDVPGKTAIKADSSFPLEVGERVTIKASYSPFSADVDFGLIAPDGLFYYVNVSGGSVDQTIEVTQRGHYILAVRNNSSATISVSGYINY